MQERPNIAVFIDYDNIEIGVKSTLGREFDVALALNALKERGDVVAKFAYANWGRQEGATRKMAENAVQMVQRIPSPRGDKNGADINLALDALEMAFTHDHINAFAIVSGDSDFIPLVNKLREYGKTVFVLGGKAFTSTILQQNCHEFISYESLLDESQKTSRQPSQRAPRKRQAALDPAHAMPLVERALQVLERRGVQPQLGLLKSTMLQLDPAFSEKDYGAGSFSEFVEKLRNAGYVELSGSEGRYIIERKSAAPAAAVLDPEEALPLLRDVLETHRLELENGRPAEEVEAWFRQEHPDFNPAAYGFREFAEFLNYAQDKLVVRIEPHEDKGLLVFLGAEFYPPADLDVPAVASALPEKPKKRRAARRKRGAAGEDGASASATPPRRRRRSAAEAVK
ncbi:MAG: NYN domain-containing protein [Bryobacteraceae bacterium]|jgi:uncharacterized protein (TIGR00288 family)|nr:NYN domain-containing protein [Bryobacteraceae bacterium]